VKVSWLVETRDQPKPIPITYVGSVRRQGESLPFEDAEAVLLCGFIGCDRKPFNPLVDALPRMVHLPSRGAEDWIAPVLQKTVMESRQNRAGSAAVLERASEMLFVDSARRYLESLPEGAPGWLGALRDRHVGKAIALMHQRPSDPWTVEELGHEVGLSRSALHERFVELVGQPPMQYLANWRIQRGALLLRETKATVATIALEVGYESEAAFSRAFKRLVGTPPATWRRAQAGNGTGEGLH
jgi:AraC-like DNA-binding protein